VPLSGQTTQQLQPKTASLPAARVATLSNNKTNLVNAASQSEVSGIHEHKKPAGGAGESGTSTTRNDKPGNGSVANDGHQKNPKATGEVKHEHKPTPSPKPTPKPKPKPKAKPKPTEKKKEKD
jgi:hypothetical protein